MATFLIVQRGPEIGKRYDLQGAIITIGRSDDNDITFDDPYISRYHAVVKQQGADLVIIDLGSENPVQIRDTPLEPGDPYTLQNRDVVRIGQNVLSYIDTSKIPARPAPTSAPAVVPQLPQSPAVQKQPEVSQGAISMADALQPGSYAPPISRPVNPEVVESASVSSTANPITGRYNPPPLDDQEESEMTVINTGPASAMLRNMGTSEKAEEKPTAKPEIDPGDSPSGWQNPISGNYQASGFNSPTYSPPSAEEEDDERTIMGAPGQGQYNPPAPSYGQPQAYGQPQQSGWGQSQYQQPQYNQPQYNQPQYDQGQYNQQPPQQPAWGQQNSYGQQPPAPAYGQYGQPPVQEPEEGDEPTVIGGPGGFQGWNRPAPETPKPAPEATKEKDATIKPPPLQLEPDDEDPGDAPTTIIRFDKNKF